MRLGYVTLCRNKIESKFAREKNAANMFTLPRTFDAVFLPLEFNQVLLLFALAQLFTVKKIRDQYLTEHFAQHHFVAASRI